MRTLWTLLTEIGAELRRLRDTLRRVNDDVETRLELAEPKRVEAIEPGAAVATRRKGGAT